MVNDHVHMDFPWLSASAVEQYFVCPYRYHLKYVELVPDDNDAAALRRGKEIHAAFDEFYDNYTPHKIMSLTSMDMVNTRPQDTHLYKSFQTTLSNILSMHTREDDDDYKLYELSIASFSLLQQGLVLEIAGSGGLTNDRLQKFWFPTHREQFVQSTEQQLYGYVDQARNDTDGSIVILDYKIGGGKARVKKIKPAWRRQANHYRLCWAEMYGMDPNDIKYYIVAPHVKYGELPNIYEIKYNLHSTNTHTRKLKKIRDSITRGIFPKAVEGIVRINGKLDEDVMVTSTPDSPFLMVRLCAHCPYTMPCLNVEKEQLNTDIRMQFKNAVLDGD